MSVEDELKERLIPVVDGREISFHSNKIYLPEEVRKVLGDPKDGDKLRAIKARLDGDLGIFLRYDG